MNSEKIAKFAKVFAWAFGSSVVAGVLYWVGSDAFPVEYLWLAPTINTILFGVKMALDELKGE